MLFNIQFVIETGITTPTGFINGAAKYIINLWSKVQSEQSKTCNSLVGEPDPQNFEEVVLFTNSFLVFFSLKYESWGARKMMSAQSLLLRTVCKN